MLWQRRVKKSVTSFSSDTILVILDNKTNPTNAIRSIFQCADLPDRINVAVQSKRKLRETLSIYGSVYANAVRVSPNPISTYRKQRFIALWRSDAIAVRGWDTVALKDIRNCEVDLPVLTAKINYHASPSFLVEGGSRKFHNEPTTAHPTPLVCTDFLLGPAVLLQPILAKSGRPVVNDFKQCSAFLCSRAPARLQSENPLQWPPIEQFIPDSISTAETALQKCGVSDNASALEIIEKFGSKVKMQRRLTRIAAPL